MSKTRKVEPIEAFDTAFGAVTIGADESVKYHFKSRTVLPANEKPPMRRTRRITVIAFTATLLVALRHWRC